MTTLTVAVEAAVTNADADDEEYELVRSTIGKTLSAKNFKVPGGLP